MKSDDSNFILNLMDKINYEIKVDIPLEKINFVNKTNIYKKNINTIQNYNYDNLISIEYNDNIDNILNDNLSIKKFINICSK